jgi:hypothetical protein
MKLYLDTEFNAFGGKLISMALVPEGSMYPEFYCELDMNDQLHPWVRDNVVPHLIMVPCTHNEFQQKLAVYLRTIGECTIIADWPDDIRYFCESLITGPGDMINLGYNLKFELNFDIKYTSEVPHNALWDARAIRDWCIKELK